MKEQQAYHPSYDWSIVLLRQGPLTFWCLRLQTIQQFESSPNRFYAYCTDRTTSHLEERLALRRHDPDPKMRMLYIYLNAFPMRIFLESMYIFLYSSIQQAVYRVTLYFSHPSFLFAHLHIHTATITSANQQQLNSGAGQKFTT